VEAESARGDGAVAIGEEYGGRVKEKLTCGAHMSASGERDAAGAFWSIWKMCTLIVV